MDARCSFMRGRVDNEGERGEALKVEKRSPLAWLQLTGGRGGLIIYTEDEMLQSDVGM